jgi:hypothetical protein
MVASWWTTSGQQGGIGFEFGQMIGIELLVLTVGTLTKKSTSYTVMLTVKSTDKNQVTALVG